MKTYFLIFLLALFPILSKAGYVDEYNGLKASNEENLRLFRESQDKVFELNTTWNHFWREEWVRRKIAEQNRIQNDLIEEQRRNGDRIRHLENIQMVRVWSEANGVLSSKFVRLNEYLNCDCDMVQYGDDFFTDWNVARNLGNQRQANLTAASYIGQRDPYISKCMAKPGNRSVSVARTSSDLCRLPDSRRGTSVRYKLRNDRDAITLEMKLNLSYVGDAANKAESQKRINQARTCVEQFYSRFGINMVLSFDTNSNYRSSGHHKEIDLHDRFPRANASHWATHHTVGRDMDERSVCALIVHEMGHNLGLPDTYADPDCPDRPMVLPYPNVMSNSHYSPDDLEFNDNQIKSILGPLCD